MRAVVQRVLESSVTSEGIETGKTGKGLVVLLGVGENDTEQDAHYMADKVSKLRVFDDEDGKMNLSVQDVSGEVLAISQFTLFGDAKKGNRPSFSFAAKPKRANELYREFCDTLKDMDLNVQEGVFQTDMLVKIHNDGPVTILLDSKKEF